MVLGEVLKQLDKVKEKKVIFDVKLKNGEFYEVPMVDDYYIANGFWYSRLCKNIEETEGSRKMTNYSFLDLVEQECCQYPEDWGDLYISPMDDIGKVDFEVAFFGENYEYENFEVLEIVKIVETEKEIIIRVKED